MRIYVQHVDVHVDVQVHAAAALIAPIPLEKFRFSIAEIVNLISALAP